jgi:hypothetical protein
MYQFTDQPTKRSTLSKSWLIGIGLTVLLVVIIVIVVLWQEGLFNKKTKCKNGQTLINGKCTCSAENTILDVSGNCVKCSTNTVANTDKTECVCTSGYEDNDTQGTPTCECPKQKNKIEESGNCVCKSSYVADSNDKSKCVCPPKRVDTNGKCECNPTYVDQGDNCVCPQNKVEKNGQCVCQEGFFGETCIDIVGDYNISLLYYNNPNTALCYVDPFSQFKSGEFRLVTYTDNIEKLSSFSKTETGGSAYTWHLERVTGGLRMYCQTGEKKYYMKKTDTLYYQVLTDNSLDSFVIPMDSFNQAMSGDNSEFHSNNESGSLKADFVDGVWQLSTGEVVLYPENSGCNPLKVVFTRVSSEM